MGQGNGESEQGKRLPTAQGFRDAWSKALRPYEQTPELAQEVDLFARRATRLARQLLRYIFIAAVIVIVLLALLLIVFAAVTTYDILSWSGLLHGSHRSLATAPRIVAPIGMLSANFAGVC